MKILINERLSEHRCKTPEGYLICTDAILARTGKQTYRKNEIFKDSDDETEIEVDRTEDEVFSPQTLASFENKPVTVEHPDEDVNVHNYKEYAVGFVRDVRRGEVDGQPVILGNLVITDEQTIQEIENGEHTDLSCGYDCDIADEPNPCQRNIRGNHVALCECGRAGIARIVDSDVPRGYKVTGNNYAWELAGTAKDKKEAVNKFVRKYPELENIWGISELLNFMIQSNKDVERDTELGYALHFDYDEYTKKFYIAFVEKKYRYDNSVKDARMKVANLVNGYAIVPTSRWRKFGLNAEVERFATNLDEARYIRSSLERNDGISFIIVDVTQRRTTDSMKDAKYVIMHPRKNLYLTVGAKTWSYESDLMIKKFDSVKEAEEYAKKNTSDFRIAVFDSVNDTLIPPTKEAINKFESLLRILNVKIDRKGLTTFGRVHYQVRANMEFAQFVKTLERIDDEMNKLGIPMTFNAASDGNTCTAGIDLDKQYVKDSQRAQKIQKIVKIVKSIK